MNPLIYLEISTSTNIDILRFINEESQFTALYTFNQTQGKGQYDNSWEMIPAENLAFSFVVKVKDVNLPDSLFNFHTANIFRDFIANLTQQNTEIKWPNDLILNKKKIAGLLIEKKKIENEDVYIIGFGLNVLQTDFSKLPKAGSLLTQTGRKFHLKKIAENLFDVLETKILLPENVLLRFNAHLFMKDQIAVFSLDGKRQNGIIKSADEEGYLSVDLEHDGLKKFFHKEIELLY